MCPKPKIPDPVQYQEAKAPAYQDPSQAQGGRTQMGGGTGRRGTILTGGSGVMDAGVTGKKSLLGS